MELNGESAAGARTAFRKPSNDAANRKYRRHSPSGSISSDEIPKHDHRTSPTPKGDAYGKRVTDDHERRMSDRSELEKDSGRSDPYRSSDRHFRRLVDRRDHGSRDNKCANEDDRDSRRSSGHSGRESRRGSHSDRIREEREYGRSKDYNRVVDKNIRDRYDGSGYRSRDKERESLYERHKHKSNDIPSERSGSGRSYSKYETESDKHDIDRGDYRSKRTCTHEESRGYQHNSSSRRNDSGSSWRDTYKSDQKDSGQNASAGDRQNHDRKSPAKKSKFSSSAYIEQSSNSKQLVDIGDKATAGKASGTEAAGDLDAAKLAAIRAAELVNKNLSGSGAGTGSGAWTTEQKKKLLWGNKKKTTTDEPGIRWDAALIGDRERQEKFNKLMGVKGDVKAEQKLVIQDAEKQRELQLDLEKQYTAGLRRRDGRTVGLGL